MMEIKALVSLVILLMILLVIIDLYMDYKILKSQKNVLIRYEIIYCQELQGNIYSYFIDAVSISKAGEKFYAHYPREHYKIIKIN